MCTIEPSEVRLSSQSLPVSRSLRSVPQIYQSRVHKVDRDQSVSTSVIPQRFDPEFLIRRSRCDSVLAKQWFLLHNHCSSFSSSYCHYLHHRDADGDPWLDKSTFSTHRSTDPARVLMLEVSPLPSPRCYCCYLIPLTRRLTFLWK